MSDNPETLLEIEAWRRDEALLDAILEPEDNHKYISLYTENNTVKGYWLHFSHKYLFERTTRKLEEYGFEFVSLVTDTYRDDADFRVRFDRFREPTAEELEVVDLDHTHVPESVVRIGSPSEHDQIIKHHHC